MKIIFNNKRWRLCFFLLIIFLICSLIAGYFWRANSSNNEYENMENSNYSELCLENNEADKSYSNSDKGVKLPVIMYHSVIEGNRDIGDYVVSAEILENDLEWLKIKGYETVFVKDVVDYVKNDGILPEKPVMITFDDGDKNNMTVALKVMEEYGAKGVYSVVGKFCESEEGYMSWEELKKFSENPLVEIQNHSYNMHSLGIRRGSGKKYGEGEAQYIYEFAKDTSKMQSLLKEKIGITAICYTYPFGIIGDESQNVLKSLNFEAALTCFEKENIIRREELDCLYSINRYNRRAGESTESYMKRLTEEK